jgi:hypothetical protein
MLREKKWETYQSSLAIGRQMAQVNCWVRNCRILIIVSAALYEQDLEIRVCFCESSSCDAGCGSAACEDDVDFAGRVLVGGHCGCSWYR